MASQEFQRWEASEPYIDLHCQLGEGPYYEKESNSLRFVDIQKKQLLSFSLDEGPGSLKALQLDVPVSVTADVEGHDPREKILLGLKYGMALLDRKTGRYEYITKFEPNQDNERLRSNDGAVDPHGRFWLGSMTDFGHGPFKPEGSLIRFDGGKTREVVRPDLIVPNSVGWSPDHRTMYFTHSTSRTVFAFDYNPDDGSLSNERVFYQHAGPGDPDGFRVDVDGNLWHAIYGGANVIKISPEGKLLGEVKLPTLNITCPQFVGTELFITTAADETGKGGEKSKAFGGGLFRVDVGTTGIDMFNFKSSA